MNDFKAFSTDIYPVAMTVAGSDSGGGAGIEADLRTFNALSVYGCCAICGLTAQNPTEVRNVIGVTPEMVTAQIETVLDKIKVKAVKTGMLTDSATVSAVAKCFAKRPRLPLVIDPVMMATSGGKLLEDEAIEILQKELLPQAHYLTPNIPEAELLLGNKLRDEKDLAAAAGELGRRFRCGALVKGGHLSAKLPVISDYFYSVKNGKTYKISSPFLRLPKFATHGTGCTLSAAIAALLAVKAPEMEVIRQAKAFILGSLIESVTIGARLVAMYPPEFDHSEEIIVSEFK